MARPILLCGEPADINAGMIGWMFVAVAFSHPLSFPEAPIAGSVAQGRLVFRHGAGIDRTLMGDRVSTGTWFDGRIRRTVDSATWLSPSLVSRWLGYEAEREAWDDGEVDRHWKACRDHLDGQITVVVRLAAFPRLDPLDFGIGADPKPETLKNIRCRLSYTPTRPMEAKQITISAPAECVAIFEKEEAAPVTDRPFYSLTNLAPLFQAGGDQDLPDDGIRLGDYYGAVYVVRFPVARQMRGARSLDLTIQLKTQRERARFSLFEVPPGSRVQASDED